MPAGPLAYAAGLTRVRARHFLAGMMLGGAPRVFAYTALDGSLADLSFAFAIVALALLAALTLAGGITAVRLRPAQA